MAFFRFKIFFPALLGLFAIGCGGGSDKDGLDAHLVSGKITYKRLPIRTDANGYPLGLETPDNAETMPLRGITVRAVYLLTQETMPDGSKVDIWWADDATTTNINGEYSLDLKDDALPAYIEVQSAFRYSPKDSPRITMRLIADPKGINSAVPQTDRVTYSIRKGLDGSSQEDSPTPAVAVKGKITLNFDIGLNDKWWIGHTSAKYAPDAVLETTGTGSRVAAIIDTAYKAASTFGNPTPDNNLDLHYCNGVTESMGTYVEYNRERFPLAFDPASGALRYFGSVRGGPQYDDAWDEGVLLSMMARNHMRSLGMPLRFNFPSKKFTGFDARNNALMTNLQPTMAMAEGLPDAMAAIVLKTPYLTSASGTIVRDIRSTAGLPPDVYSGPAITAFTWELALKANDIASPGNPGAWDDIDPLSINRFYALLSQTEINDEGDIEFVDLPSLFTQLTRLSETIESGDAVDLASIFTDELITRMTTPFFGAIWPRPAEGPLSCFVADWGSNPDSAKNPLPDFTFSMSDAVLDAEGIFANLTSKENLTAKITLTKDTAYWLSVNTAPPLPSGASIEVRINGNALNSYTFGPSLPNPQRVVLLSKSDTPYFYLLDFRINSPRVRVSETRVSARLDPAY